MNIWQTRVREEDVARVAHTHWHTLTELARTSTVARRRRDTNYST